MEEFYMVFLDGRQSRDFRPLTLYLGIGFIMTP